MSANASRPQHVYSTAHGDLVFGRRCLVMGILNVTPDSFSDGGRHFATDVAIHRAIEMVREGADCIDVGGESTRPGSLPVSAAEQIDRVVPVIRGARSAGVTVPISIDTQSAEVAAKALDAGGDIVNDVSAVRQFEASGDEQQSCAENQSRDPDQSRDRKGAVPTKAESGSAGSNQPTKFHHESSNSAIADAANVGSDNAEMLSLLAERDMPFIIMHMLGTPATMQSAPRYDDVVREVGEFFSSRAKALEEAGVATNGRMIVDPGIGFGKTLEHNLALIRAAAHFGERWPVLLGTSRKRFIGDILAGIPGREAIPDADARLMGTAATVAHAALTGVDMVRVHDVKEMRNVVEICQRLAAD